MLSEQADLYLTDPPYNVDYTGGTKDALKIQNDCMPAEAYDAFLLDAFKAADQVLSNGAAFYIWHACSTAFEFYRALKGTGWQIKQVLVWVKNSLVIGRQDYQWKHEPCLYGWKEGAAHHWYSDRSQTSVLEFNKPLHNTEHPTMKPIELFNYLIKNSSKRGDIVLDSFAGSGTTILACEHLGRRARCIELEPKYCDVIIQRWQELTGEKANRADGVSWNEISPRINKSD